MLFLTAYGFDLNIMAFTIYLPALEPDLATAPADPHRARNRSQPTKSCPVSQSYLGALNQADAVWDIAVSSNMLQKRRKGELGQLLPPAQK